MVFKHLWKTFRPPNSSKDDVLSTPLFVTTPTPVTSSSAFAQQYEHLHHWQCLLRSIKRDIEPLLFGASSIPSIPKPVEALKHFEFVMEHYCEAFDRLIDQIADFGACYDYEKEEHLLGQWIMIPERSSRYLRTFGIPTIRELVKELSCRLDPNTVGEVHTNGETPITHVVDGSTPLKAEPSVQPHPEIVEMGGNITDDSNEDRVPFLTVADTDSVRQTVEISHLPVLNAFNQENPSQISHCNDDHTIPEIIISLSDHGDHSNEHPNNDSLVNQDLMPIPILGTEPKKKSSNDSTTNLVNPPSLLNAWREGSRPISISKSVNAFVGPIEATKHPPITTHTGTSREHVRSAFSIFNHGMRCVNSYQHMHDEPWPDGQSVPRLINILSF